MLSCYAEPHWLVDVRLISRAGLYVNTVLTPLLITRALPIPDLLAFDPAFRLVRDRGSRAYIPHPIRPSAKLRHEFVTGPSPVVTLHIRIRQKLRVEYPRINEVLHFLFLSLQFLQFSRCRLDLGMCHRNEPAHRALCHLWRLQECTGRAFFRHADMIRHLVGFPITALV